MFCSCRGSGLFGAFTSYLKTPDKAAPEEVIKREAYLVKELEAIDRHLQEKGPFICGANISAADLALSPKIYHVFHATEQLKVMSDRL